MTADHLPGSPRSSVARDTNVPEPGWSLACPGDIIAALRLPPESMLSLRVTKKDLGERVATLADRRLVNELVESCTWVATLTPTTCGLAAVRDEACEYREIPILTVRLRSAERRARLHAVLHRAIPYPLLLISDGDDPAMIPTHLSLAPLRRARNGTAEVVLADVPISTADLTLVTDHTPGADFLASLAVGHGAPADLGACYHGWINRVEALHAAELTGRWVLPRTHAEAQRRRTALVSYANLGSTLAAHGRQLKHTTQLAKVVEANLALQAIRQQQRDLLFDLSLETVP